MPQEGLPDPAAGYVHPAAGFLSEADHAAHLVELRTDWREFTTEDLALGAIRAVLDDESINNDARVSLVRAVLTESGWRD